MLDRHLVEVIIVHKFVHTDIHYIQYIDIYYILYIIYYILYIIDVRLLQIRVHWFDSGTRLH